MNEMEIWRDITNVPGARDFQISNLGRVRNLHTKNILRPGAHNNDRLRVNLYFRGKHHHIYVHRLVAAAFIPDFREDDGLEFINGDTMDVRASNLRVGGRRINRRIPKNMRIQIVETGEKYPSMSAAARAVDGQPGNVRRVLEGSLNSHKGFTYRYVAA